MGAATRHRQAFLRGNPFCIFCGGGRPAVSIEHCPPRSMFQNRQWPAGFEFPACGDCNHGTSDDDAVIAMLGRIDHLQSRAEDDGKFAGLVMNLRKQRPDLLRRLSAGAKEIEISTATGERRTVYSVSIPDEVHDAVWTLAAKLTKGIFHMETGEVFPTDGCISAMWLANADIEDGTMARVLAPFMPFMGAVPELKRADKLLNDQFEYQVAVAPDPKFMVLVASIGTAFAIATLSCATPRVLEAMFERVKAQHGGKAPFLVIQRAPS